jgi:hypothetical protein
MLLCLVRHFVFALSPTTVQQQKFPLTIALCLRVDVGLSANLVQQPMDVNVATSIQSFEIVDFFQDYGDQYKYDSGLCFFIDLVFFFFFFFVNKKRNDRLSKVFRQDVAAGQRREKAVHRSQRCDE